MNRLLVLCAMLFLAFGCKTIPEAVEHRTNVKFEEKSDPDFISPQFHKTLDSNYTMSFLVRAPLAPTSEIVSENLSVVDEPVLKLENSLAQHFFRVYDRAVYQDHEAANENLEYPFDYFMEIVELEDTRHYTGIVLHHNYHHFLEGKIMTVKLVDTQSGEIVALINAEYVPCANGCKIRYTNTEILSVRDFQDKEVLQRTERNEELLTDEFTYLSNEISRFIKIEMIKNQR